MLFYYLINWWVLLVFAKSKARFDHGINSFSNHQFVYFRFIAPLFIPFLMRGPLSHYANPFAPFLNGALSKEYEFRNSHVSLVRTRNHRLCSRAWCLGKPIPIRIFIALQCALSNHRPRARCNFVLVATCRLSRST